MTGDAVRVDDLVDAVKRSITAANLSAANRERDLRVSVMELTLNTMATSTAGGGLELKVPVIGLRLKAGTKLTKVDLHTLVINLEAAPGGVSGELRDYEVDEALVSAVEQVRAAVAAAGMGDDPFVLRDSTMTLSFGVTAEGSIVLGFEGNLQDSVTQALKLTLVPA
ncbi:trypco2 family protein [Actinoplanes sp. CA-142083]|uniref:trypco2 family protein n=1 Tax=Actinoplanes sp. CA-142083 TaxID=3239903 RepID=UPI003D92D66E